jgi:hypothetical protein
LSGGRSKFLMSFLARSWLKRTHLERVAFHFRGGGLFSLFGHIFTASLLVGKHWFRRKGYKTRRWSKSSGRTRCRFSRLFISRITRLLIPSPLFDAEPPSRANAKDHRQHSKTSNGKKDAGAERNACYETMTAVCFYSCVFGGGLSWWLRDEK